MGGNFPKLSIWNFDFYYNTTFDRIQKVQYSKKNDKIYKLGRYITKILNLNNDNFLFKQIMHKISNDIKFYYIYNSFDIPTTLKVITSLIQNSRLKNKIIHKYHKLS